MILIVKSTFPLSGIASFLIVAILSSMLCACGQRGPLYLPKPEASSIPAQAVPPPSEPASAPASDAPSAPVSP
ncbi:MAG: lipoprotein [Burkholderiales bacterium]